MPKQSYLAELGKLLTYMTPWDRERTLEYIGKRFDEAENEAALLQELGTPVRLAVLYNRGYNPSPDPALAAQPEEAAPEEGPAPPNWEKDEPEEAPAGEAAEAEEMPAEEEAPSAAEAPAEDAPAQEVPAEDAPAEEAPAEDEPVQAEEAPAEEAEAIPEETVIPEDGPEAQEEAPPEAEAPVPAEEAPAEELPAEEVPAEGASAGNAEEAPAGKEKPGAGRVIAVAILSVFPGVPLFVLLLVIDALLFTPGIAGIGAALVLVEAGTFALTHVADALLVFGAALIVFALALGLLYGGLWCSVKLTRAYFKGICALMRGILGKGGRSK